jgi:hypothetical protein
MKLLAVVLLSLALAGSGPAQQFNENLAHGGLPWQVHYGPATASQATITQAAVVGHRHVATCIAFAGASVSAPSLTFMSVYLRDGASGSGAILMQFPITISASAGQNVAPFAICGLTVIGTAGNAMTLEFSAGLTNLAQAVNLSGFDL